MLALPSSRLSLVLAISSSSLMLCSPAASRCFCFAAGTGSSSRLLAGVGVGPRESPAPAVLPAAAMSASARAAPSSTSPVAALVVRLVVRLQHPNKGSVDRRRPGRRRGDGGGVLGLVGASRVRRRRERGSVGLIYTSPAARAAGPRTWDAGHVGSPHAGGRRVARPEAGPPCQPPLGEWGDPRTGQGLPRTCGSDRDGRKSERSGWRNARAYLRSSGGCCWLGSLGLFSFAKI
jgi:hypothetical protein